MWCYARDHMGELIHIEIKTLVRFNGVGHCISTDCEGQSIRRGTGGEYVYVCFAEASRVSFTDIFPDQRATIARALRAAAVAYYNSFRVTVTCVKTDTDSCYKAFAFRDDYKHLGRRYVCTGPLTQRTNSNAERLIKTILTEWACTRAGSGSGQRQPLDLLPNCQLAALGGSGVSGAGGTDWPQQCA